MYMYYSLSGSEKFLDNILKLTDEDPSMLMTGVKDFDNVY